ncbi:hypothetical protein [Granulicella sp. dw_53]|uniref:lipopolysaccharide biosynthesis protein n=1 Tax=Granulicella sp. dw_53 TaxID=2719792 RepID=UPI001BD64998|nr:hypothetical protein [Granulicella sp. dw_53]
MQSKMEDAAPSLAVLRRGLGRLRNSRTPAALLDQILVSGANFGTNILLARGFSLRDYGVFALAWLAVLFANSLQYALIITPMMSVGPKQETPERPAYFGSVLLQELIFASLAALVVLIAVALSTRYFPSWNVGNIAGPLSAATSTYLLQDFIRRYFFCIGKSSWALGSDLVSYGLQLPIIFWLSHSHRATITSALWIVAGTSFGGFLPFMVKYGPTRFDVHSMREVLKRHWKMSRWLAPTAFMQWGATNLFLMSAPFYYGAAASAVLRASQNIVAVAHIWILGLDNIVPAEAARQMYQKGSDGMLCYLKKVFLRWGGVSLAFTALIASFPRFWLELAYGEKYSSNGHVLRLYALLYLVIFVAGPLRAGLLALEYTLPIFWAYPIMIAFSVLLAGPFARQLGLEGVILGMLGTQLIFQGVIGFALIFRVKKMRRESLEQVALVSEV